MHLTLFAATALTPSPARAMLLITCKVRHMEIARSWRAMIRTAVLLCLGLLWQNPTLSGDIQL